MRISRLQLRNFRAFRELDITFDPATLLVGANDAGKTTIIEAISVALATGHDIWQHAPGALAAGGGVDWEQVVHRGGVSEGGDERVFVSVTFDELSESEQDSWRAVLDTGAPLRLGRMWGKDQSSGTLCVVLDRPHYLRLVEDAGLGDEDHPWAQPGEQEDYLREPPTIEDEVWCNFFWLGDMTATFGTQFLGLIPEPEVNVIHIPGPEAAIQEPEVVLRPLLRSVVARSASLPGPADADDPWDQPDDLGPLLGQLGDAASTAIDAVSEGFDTVVSHFTGGAIGAGVERRQRHRSVVLRRIVDDAIGDLHVALRRPGQTAEGSPTNDREVPTDASVPIERPGAGVRRAALLAGLELYRDPELWTPNEHVILMIEEPEVGLHPGAQRRLASALATLPTYGLQVIVVSHSPTFVGVFPTAAIRLVRTAPGDRTSRTVVLPEHLREVADELGVDPSDVLLARRFMVVEGTSDAKALRAWARTLGLETRSRGIQLIPARGESRASTLTQFLEVAYEGASFVVLLDGGKQTECTAAELRDVLGERIEVRRLDHDQVEKYYSANAIAAWLVMNGVTLDAERKVEMDGILADGIDKGALQHLTGRYLDREYHVEKDGGMIARLMREQDIAPELRILLFDLFGD